jgi:hypothetical protein
MGPHLNRQSTYSIHRRLPLPSRSSCLLSHSLPTTSFFGYGGYFRHPVSRYNQEIRLRQTRQYLGLPSHTSLDRNSKRCMLWISQQATDFELSSPKDERETVGHYYSLRYPFIPLLEYLA